MNQGFDVDLDVLASRLSPRRRFGSVDALRGLAVLAMIAFHATWTAAHFGFLSGDALDGPLGRWSARVITAVFLFVVGLSLVLAHEAGMDRRRFFRRFLVLVAAAVLVSVATIYALPQSPIYFGVLHCIALSSLLALPFLRWRIVWPAVVAIIVFALLALRLVVTDAGLSLLWLGIAQNVPSMADYVPLVPWFGFVLLGVVAARAAVLRPRLFFALPDAFAPLCWIGRRALPIYLLHQPLLFALAMGLAQLGIVPIEDPFVQTCTTTCMEGGQPQSYCARTCQCVSRSFAEKGLDPILFSAPSPTDVAFNAIIKACSE